MSPWLWKRVCILGSPEQCANTLCPESQRAASPPPSETVDRLAAEHYGKGFTTGLPLSWDRLIHVGTSPDPRSNAPPHLNLRVVS